MGIKLDEKEIVALSLANPNEGFDNCTYCNGVERKNSMQGFDDSDTIICDECNQEKFDEIQSELDEAIDDVFLLAHQEFNTKSGDITPEQNERLESLKTQLFDLILEQVKQNL
jgi:hypothetical protein